MLTLLCVVCCMVGLVEGHGRLKEPAGRASAFRYGWNTPPNYNDNQLFCGGLFEQKLAGYKCGVCGDPYDLALNPDGIRPNEAGGMYATGTIVAHYRKGQTVDAHVQVTANHLGHISFKICAVNDHTVKATQECLDQNPLQFEDGSYKFPILASTPVDVPVRIVLPSDLVCDQCVIQWRYHTGNSWGCDSTGCDMGKGEQEEFYACSDVKISENGGNVVTPTTQANKTTTIGAKTGAGTGTVGDCTNYIAGGAWVGAPLMNTWCAANCPSNCPSDLCMCGDGI